MNRIAPLIVVLALAIISAATAAAATGADDILTDSGQTNAYTGQAETALVGFEAEQYAINFGVSTDEALRRLDRIPELKRIIQETVAAESGRVAGWGIVHEPNFGGWVYLVGDAEPTQTTNDLVARHSDLYVDTGATYTFIELNEAMSNRSNFEAIPESMRNRIAYREIDVRSNSIVVAIDRNKPPVPIDDSVSTEDRPIESLDLPQAAEALKDTLEQDTGLPFVVTLKASSEPDAIYGGELVRTERNTRCTSGFAVLEGDTRGMLTAGHCANINKHWRSRTTAYTGDSFLTTHQDTVWGDGGDSSWYTTVQQEADDFYVTTTVRRDVIDHEVRANMQGDFVCHFGVKSGYSCGFVASTTHDPNYDICGSDGCEHMWIRVEGASLKSCGGDSGGPWFQVRTAYGIHSGSNQGGDCTAEGTDYATFTAMDDILESLDLELATS